MEGYPKEVQIKDGRKVTLRPMQAGDKDKLFAFFQNVPAEDKQFLKEDVANMEVIERWFRSLDHTHVLPILAEIDDKIVGDATLHCPRFGWSRHVGEIRLVVSREFQGLGLGSILAKEIFFQALDRGLDKIEAQMMENQQRGIAAFERLGFHKEAILKEHVKDMKGNRRNLVILTHNVGELWDKMEDLITDSFFSMERQAF